MRSFLLGAKTEVKDLPYDAEVEYLESTGTQWIRTPYVYTGLEDEVLFEIDVINTLNQSAFYFIGSSTNYSPRLLQVSNYWRISCDPSGSSNLFTMTIGTRSRVACDLRRSGEITASINEGFPVSASRQFNTTPGASMDLMSSNGTSIKNGKYHSFRATIDGLVVVDMIPVRKDGVGYMYDRVSGELFGNLGTGSFIVGPDKEVA